MIFLSDKRVVIGKLYRTMSTTNRNWKRWLAIVSIIVGAIVLIIQIYRFQKNHYLQTLGVVCLMGGLFLINTSVSSKPTKLDLEVQNEEEE